MADTNVNLSVDELTDLRLKRRIARALRKSINRRRYYRRYYRIRGRGTPLGMRLVDIPVTITVTILPGATVAYGTPAITRDDLT